MQAERARLARLNRLERVRAIAKQAAAAEAAQAESTLAQLEALAERTRRMAADYGARRGIADAAALQQMVRFAGGLHGIAESTSGDAARARAVADARLTELGRAERQRAAVEERAGKQAAAIARAQEKPVLGARRETGTDLD